MSNEDKHHNIFRRRNGETTRLESSKSEQKRIKSLSEFVSGNVPKQKKVAEIENLPAGVIHSTYNYDLFKPHPLNRDINASNLSKIKRGMEYNNLLSVNPIVVDRIGYIYDGGHRFLAAKELGLEIFFTISDNLGPNDISSLNTATKPWSIEDFLEYHCKRGNQAYIEFKEIYNALMPGKKKGLTQAFLLGCSVCSSNSKERGGVAAFKAGNFTFDRKHHLLRVLHHAKQFEFVHNKWSSSAFLRAIGLMVKTPGYDPERMIKNARRRANYFHPVTTAEAYLDILEPMYNYGRSESRHLRFLRR